MATPRLFGESPMIEFRPSHSDCPECREALKSQKSRVRMVSTLHIGKFRARETILACPRCDRAYRSEELGQLAPPGANFGYDVLVYVGQALWLRYRNEQEVVDELAQKNIRISPREVSLLGMKFIVYLAIAHRHIAADITAAMRTRGGFVCHLDATCEGRDPFLMSSIDSLSEIVLGNIKLPSEHQDHIIPFLQRIKKTFGIPLALVHDMARGILKAVAQVFPGVPDFICHFHFLRDIGKDFLETEYDVIRTKLRKHEISGKLRYRARQLKGEPDRNPALIDALATGLAHHTLPAAALQTLPGLNGYTLIQWALQGKSEGHGYGFPFDRPQLSFANRIRRLHADVEQLSRTQLRGQWQDNAPYFKILADLKTVMRDKALWHAVEELEKKITVFERLRQAMRIAPQSGRHGLNDEGQKSNIKTIKQRVMKFRGWLTSRKDYAHDQDARKMIGQIDQYWDKLFADPITVQTPSGPIQIQPQRTNNILEQFFRSLKRANRRKTGNAASSRMLRTMLAETPLVRNLQNPDYMKILLNGKTTLEAVFAEIDIDTLRKEFRKAQSDPEKIPAKLKALIAMPDYPGKLVEMIRKAVA
jgi:uncharacterized C2H2 Zn-finger protein